MAQKRMFDKAIIDTDKFMDLSMSSKALYFLLGMEADDEGFVSYKKVMRIHGGNNDDIKVLIAKDFLIKFESGVVVITVWNKNNWLDKRRIKETEYIKERKMLVVNGKKEYCLATAKQPLRESSIEENRIEENSTKIAFNIFWNLYDKKVGKSKSEKKWNKLSLKDQKSILEYLPKYKHAQQDKKFRKNPETFFNNRSWEDELIEDNGGYWKCAYGHLHKKGEKCGHIDRSKFNETSEQAKSLKSKMSFKK